MVENSQALVLFRTLCGCAEHGIPTRGSVIDALPSFLRTILARNKIYMTRHAFVMLHRRHDLELNTTLRFTSWYESHSREDFRSNLFFQNDSRPTSRHTLKAGVSRALMQFLCHGRIIWMMDLVESRKGNSVAS